MKSVFKTDEEIKAERDKLASIKPTVRKRSVFGDDHHEAIDAQIAVLDGRLSLASINESWGDEGLEEFAQNVLDSAIEAYDWYTDGSSESAPSAGWSELAR